MSRAGAWVAWIALAASACSTAGSGDPDAGGDPRDIDAARAADAAPSDGATNTPDADPNAPDADPNAPDADPTDPDAAPPPPDAAPPPPDADPGPISGGPCSSGSTGATAYRIRWADGGGTAYPIYEVNGLPDTSVDHTGAYGYVIGFTPSFVDPFLGEGGLLLNSSSFVDIELSTVGLSSISNATLSIYGRSYHTTTSGSFNWQTFAGTGATPTNFVSNVAPYEWYSANMTTEIDPGDGGVLLRIKAGPSSGSLVVHRIEICMIAD